MASLSFEGPAMVFDSGSSCSSPDQIMWQLWKQQHWDRFFSQYICFPLSVLFCQSFILIFILFLLLIEGKIGRMLGHFKPSSALLVMYCTFTLLFMGLSQQLTKGHICMCHFAECYTTRYLDKDLQLVFRINNRNISEPPLSV